MIELNGTETNAQLEKIIKDNNIAIEISGKKANKGELTGAIEAYNSKYTNDAVDNSTANDEQEEIDDFLDPIEELMKADQEANIKAAKAKNYTIESVEDKKKVVKKKLTPRERRRQQFAELMKLKRVLVTSNKTNETKVDFITVSWGNRLLGHQTDRILLGKPWHIRQGALNNMKEVSITEHFMEGENVATRVIPAFNIVDLGLMSEEEYKLLAKKQAVRNAAVEAQG